MRRAFKGLAVAVIAAGIVVGAMPYSQVAAQDSDPCSSTAQPDVCRSASVDDFRIVSMHADYKLTNDDPQGTLEITETLDVDFAGANRGILRAIPQSYKGNSLHLEVLDVQRDGEPEPFITYDDGNGNTVLQIGQADVRITSEHQYVLSYKVENVITFYDTHDELFWDINGSDWAQPFGSVTVNLVHETFTDTNRPAVCFTGSTGSSESDCEVLEDVNVTETKTTRELLPKETLSIVQSFEKGYFTPMSWLERYWRQLLAAPIAVLQLGVVASAYSKWSTYGRDRKRRAVAPFFGRPKNMSVMLAHYVSDNKLHHSAISAAIIDLAIHGYVQIIERKDGRKTKHDLLLLKSTDTDLAQEETMLIDGLFGEKATVGARVEIESKKAKLHSTYQRLARLLDSEAKKRHLYDISPKSPGKHLGKHIALSLVLAVVGVLLSGVTSGLSLLAGLVGFVLVAIFAVLMPRRSQAGAELKEHMDGLKLYLDMAEKDRITQQDAVEAPLAPRSGQSTRDVQFFERLLPFAVAMGVEKSWSDAFADIYKQAPEWFEGDWKNGFTTAGLVSGLTSTGSAIGQSFSAPSSSSGSGFSGGSAGGGGGGGGGGGW